MVKTNCVAPADSGETWHGLRHPFKLIAYIFTAFDMYLIKISSKVAKKYCCYYELFLWRNLLIDL